MDNLSEAMLQLIIQGLISLVFGIIGGYVGSWIQYRFARRLEREREQRALRDKLTQGVAEIVEKSQTAALAEIGGGGSPLRRLLAPAAVMLFAALAFAFSTYAGLAAMFAVGLVVGGRIRV